MADEQELDLTSLADDCGTELQIMLQFAARKGVIPPARMAGYIEACKLNDEQLAQLEARVAGLAEFIQTLK